MDDSKPHPQYSDKQRHKLCPICFGLLPIVSFGSFIFCIICGVLLHVFFIQLAAFNRVWAMILSGALFFAWNFANYYRHYSEHSRYEKAVRRIELKSPASVQTTMELIKTAILIEPVTHRDNRWRSISHIAGDPAHEVLTAELPFICFLQQLDLNLTIEASRDTDGTMVSISYFSPYQILPLSHSFAFERTTDQIRKALQPHTVPGNLSIEPNANQRNAYASEDS